MFKGNAKHLFLFLCLVFLFVSSYGGPPVTPVTSLYGAMELCLSRPAFPEEACANRPAEVGAGDKKVTLRCEVIGNECKANQQDVDYYMELLQPQIKSYKNTLFLVYFFSSYFPIILQILFSIFIFLQIKKFNLLRKIYLIKLLLTGVWIILILSGFILFTSIEDHVDPLTVMFSEKTAANPLAGLIFLIYIICQPMLTYFVFRQPGQPEFLKNLMLVLLAVEIWIFISLVISFL